MLFLGGAHYKVITQQRVIGGQATPRVEIGIDFELGCLVSLINVHIRPTLVQVVVELIGSLGVESADEVSHLFLPFRPVAVAIEERWE